MYLLRGLSSAAFSLSLASSLRFLEPVLDALWGVPLSATTFELVELEGPAIGSPTAGRRLKIVLALQGRPCPEVHQPALIIMPIRSLPHVQHNIDRCVSHIEEGA